MLHAVIYIISYTDINIKCRTQLRSFGVFLRRCANDNNITFLTSICDFFFFFVYL